MTFSSVFGFFASVSNICFKCFVYLQTHIVNVSYGCLKSRSDVAHVAMAPVAGEQRPAAWLRLLPCAAQLTLLSLPFPSLHLAAAVRARPGRRVWRHWSGMGHGWGRGTMRAAMQHPGCGTLARMDACGAHFRIFGQGARGAPGRAENSLGNYYRRVLEKDKI
jgi:hypothetical protein